VGLVQEKEIKVQTASSDEGKSFCGVCRNYKQRCGFSTRTVHNERSMIVVVEVARFVIIVA